MTDRELLELAAKAMQAAGHPDFANYTVVEHAVCLDLGACRGAITSYWNPLTDDGDALRMAVKLGISINRFGAMTSARLPMAAITCDERDDGDPYAATRRAVVRAAAEIGRSEL